MADTDSLVAALARAQMAFPPIPKGHVNPHFKSRYADLADVLAAVRPCLNAEGIALTQPIQTDDDGRVRLYTILEGHGETRSASLPLYLDNMTPQQLLSTLTYYRRGLLAALLGVAAEDDDDGNAAQTAPARTFKQTEYRSPTKADMVGDVVAPDKPVDTMTVQELIGYAREIGVPVKGSKQEMVYTLTPYAMAATGAEPFDLTPPENPPERNNDHDKPFEPVVANPASVVRRDLAGTERHRLDSAAKT